jgi:predicted GIY-YIG superfamily endonuclease
MVEHNQENRDKIKASREKRIKKVKRNKKEKKIEQDLRDVTKGKVSPEEFDDMHSG